VIDSFRGEYRWLSTNWPAQVELGGMRFPSVEHAYQAAKTTDARQRAQFLTGSPGDAKRLGRRVTMRPDWEVVKVDVMRDLLRQKFARGSELAAKLIATGAQPLVEGNTWGDTFWGVCRGKGENNLGRLLMQVRDEVRS
jgi:ribA/ribD-fused uncharacterized protein